MAGGGFESPRRLPASLASLAESHPERPVAVCRELTKRFEEVARGSASWRRGPDAAQGRVTLVVGGAPPSGRPDMSAALEAVAELLAAGAPRRVAADVVARLTGISRNRLYRELALVGFDRRHD